MLSRFRPSPALVVACLASVGALALGASAASAATITVTSTADDTTVDSSVSLREAIESINAGANVNADVAATGTYGTNDMINFASSVKPTITLGGTELSITKSVAINGPGASVLAVSGNNASRVLFVSGGSVNISALRVTGGNGTHGSDGSTNQGGGIDVEGASSTLTLTNVAVAGNTSTGDTFGMGIGISDGTLNVTDSTISGNSTTVSFAAGGGIWQDGGNMTLTNVTINGNTSGLGGGISQAISNTEIATLLNVTLASNHAGSSGGNVFATKHLSFANTIISGGTASSKGDCAYNTGDAPQSQGHNLEDSNTCNLTAGGDQTNKNPQLGPLQNNGGQTDTQALLTGSLAIDAGSNAAGCPTTDQRGQPRPDKSEPACDVGAFEHQDSAVVKDKSPPTITISTPAAGAHYKQGTKVNASYSCSDPDGPADVVLCAGPAANGAPIDTSTAGPQSFTVQAADKAGNSSKKTVHYTVDTTPASPPVLKGLPPNEGCVTKVLSLRISVHPTALKRALVSLDGKQVASSKKPNFKLKLAASQLKPGRHKLLIERDYKSGTKRRSTFSFSSCKGGGRSPHIRTQGTPDRGSCTAKPFKVVVTISGAVKKSIVAKLDGKSFAKPGKSKFTLKIDVTKLKPGVHHLTISAADKFKNSSVSTTDFVRCP